jgi:phage baseplate assembly protein W
MAKTNANTNADATSADTTDANTTNANTTTTPNNNFLRVGWASLVKFKDKKLEITKCGDAVHQSIWMILSTAKGERIMRPDFGCGIHDLVFATNNAGTQGQIASDVQNALMVWEPRIDILSVDVTPDARQGNVLLIRLDYRVRMTNDQFNLVYPFYLT